MTSHRSWSSLRRAAFVIGIVASVSCRPPSGECGSCDDETRVRVFAYVEPPFPWALVLNGVEVRRDGRDSSGRGAPWFIGGTLRRVADPLLDVEIRDESGATRYLAQVETELEVVQDECNEARTCDSASATIEIHEFLPPPGDDDSSDDDSASE